MERKWFIVEVYSDFIESTDIEVVFATDQEVVAEHISNVFYNDEDSRLRITELTTDGKKIVRSDLSDPVIDDRNNRYEQLD